LKYSRYKIFKLEVSMQPTRKSLRNVHTTNFYCLF